MVEFSEELLRQRMWHWMEVELGMRVDGEVGLGTGRIDLVGKSSEGTWGVEVKVGGFSTEQVDRYAESARLDQLYVASGKKLDPENSSVNVRTLSQTSKRIAAGIAEDWYTKEEFKEELSAALSSEQKQLNVGRGTLYDYVTMIGAEAGLNKEPMSIKDGIRRIQNAISFSKIGIIHVPPAPLHVAMSVGAAPDPKFLQQADELNKEKTIEFNRREEPWVRHQLWRTYGGIPEGHVPNTLKSDRPYRPIDLITFQGSDDPTDAMQHPEENKILGFEAKGEGSFSKSRLSDQLTQFLSTSTLSQLYLAVPKSIKEEAMEFVSTNPEFDKVGVIVVATDGSVTTTRQAGTMIPENDGYIERQTGRKTGYGDKIPTNLDQTVVSPYVTDEEAVRLRYTDPEPVADELLTEDIDRLDDTEYVASEVTTSLRTPLDNSAEEPSGARAYVLVGETVTELKRKEGLVEMKLSYFNDEDILLLDFSRYLGGYIWFTSRELDSLQSVLHSIELVEAESVAGQGFMYASDTRDRRIRASTEPEIEVPDTPDDAHYTEAADYERRTELNIRSNVADLGSAMNEDTVASVQLGGDGEGVDLEISRAQLVDLIASIEILRENTGKTAELPKQETESWSQARITRSGELVENVDEIDYHSEVIR